MALSPRLELRQGQRLGLSQRVLASLAVLRLPAMDLAEHLAAEARVNPFLVPGLPPAQPSAQPMHGALTGAADAVALLGAAEPAWQEALLRQIGMMSVPPRTAALAVHLVGELDERGWLDTPLAEIAARDGLDPADLGPALAVVQACEPAGVGARDLDECLRLQLLDLGLPEAEARATLAELPRFARRDWAGLARALGLSAAEVEARAALLRRLTPRPIQPAPPGPEAPLRPDLVLVRSAAGPDRVEPARAHLPRPRIDAALARRAVAEGFGADLLERARALVRAVESRGSTLQRIGDWLAVRQAAALRDGPGALRPATRAEAAADLGLHPSTVGRAVAGKALLADGRLWPLAALFSAGLTGTGDGPDAPRAARAVAHRLAALIAAEPPDRPLSDERLTKLLVTEGVDIARRTVAKYRNGLRIPPAHRRRVRG